MICKISIPTFSPRDVEDIFAKGILTLKYLWGIINTLLASQTHILNTFYHFYIAAYMLIHWIPRHGMTTTNPFPLSDTICRIETLMLNDSICSKTMNTESQYMQIVFENWHIEGSVQDYSNSIANALESLRPYTKPSICYSKFVFPSAD